MITKVTDHKYSPSPITNVTCFDVARHLCHNKGDRQCFIEVPKMSMSKVTCIIFMRHLYRKGNVQQQRATFVRVTLGRFLHSGRRRQRSCAACTASPLSASPRHNANPQLCKPTVSHHCPRLPFLLCPVRYYLICFVSQLSMWAISMF